MMKPPLLLLMLFVSGCAGKKEIKTSAPNSTAQQTVDTAIAINTSQIDIAEILKTEIPEDSLIKLIYQDEEPGNINAINSNTDNYSTLKGNCSNGILYTIRRVNESSEEKFDLAWAYVADDGALAFSSVQSFDNTPYQGESSVDINTEYALSDSCSTLAVTESYEGGDIDLTRTKKTTFFAIDEGIISEILTVEEENSRISEYFNTGKENENATSTIAEIEVLSSSTHGYRDVKISFTSKINGEISSTEEKIYKFGKTGYK